MKKIFGALMIAICIAMAMPAQAQIHFGVKGGLELVIGWFLDLFRNLRYWDYSGYFLDFRGYICLVSALGFGIAGVLWVCIFSKILQKWWYHISLDFRKKWNMFWVFIFVTDCAASLIFPNTGHSITF